MSLPSYVTTQYRIPARPKNVPPGLVFSALGLADVLPILLISCRSLAYLLPMTSCDKNIQSKK
jgi:hypothetical protein